MDKKEILSFLDNDFVINGAFYSYENIPSQIGNAIYTFGSNDITDIIAFIDCSENKDGSLGMIFTNKKIYFLLNESGIINYDEIIKLEYKKNTSISYIATKDRQYNFDNSFINSKKFIDLLSKITSIETKMILTSHEKVVYYTTIVLNDLLNDEYEDIVLSNQQQQRIQEFFYNFELINKLDQENYDLEVELLCNQALDFFDELELDSEEIDVLLELQKQFVEKKQQEDEMLEGAKKYYDDMMNKYNNGDSSMFDQVKSMMHGLGINEKDMENKSPEELNQYIEDLCTRFGISKSQIEALAKKFKL